MANSNFIVQNGLTVGPLTIDAATGSISTSGTITVTGSGQINVDNIGVSSIAKNDTSLSITDGASSNVRIIVDGVTEHTVSASGVDLAAGNDYKIGATSVLNSTTLGSGVVNSSLTSLGTIGSLVATTATAGNFSSGNAAITGGQTYIGTGGTLIANAYVGLGYFTNLSTPNLRVTTENVTTSAVTNFSSGNVLITGGTANGLTTLQATNFSTANAVIAGGSLNSTPIGASTASTGAFTTLTASGTAAITGVATVNGNLVAASTTTSTGSTTGALVVRGGAGIAGNIYLTGNISSSATGYFTIPAGTTAERPGAPVQGMIRYNSTIASYEGYSSGAWSSLGGVKSVDGLTYIRAETSAGASNDELEFFVANSGSTSTRMAKIDQYQIELNGNILINPSTNGINDAATHRATMGLTNNFFLASDTVDDFAQLAIHNSASGVSASADFIAYADTGTNDRGYIDIGINNTLFNDPIYSIASGGDGYISLSAPAFASNGISTGGNLILTTAEGTWNDIIFAAGGTVLGTEQGRFRNGDGLIIQGNITATNGEIYQGANAKTLEISSNATSTLNGSITNSQTTITVVSTTGFLNHGVLQIDSELLYYTSKTATTFTGITRGTGSTTAASHNTGATVFQVYNGITNASVVAVGNVNDAVQVALKNRSPGSNASTDLIAYASNGDQKSGWIDLGINSETFNDATYGVTGPDDGYIFLSAPLGSPGGGELHIATDGTGTSNDIVFSTNGFGAGNERMRITGKDRPGQLAGVEIYLSTNATSTSTGALRVQGGMGLQGNLYVGGNFNLVGNITIGGTGSTTSTSTLTIENPMTFLANANNGDIQDIGVVGQYKNTANVYTGLVRDSTTDSWRLFDGLSTRPTTTVTWTGTTAGNLYVGSMIVANSTASTTTTTGAFQVVGGVGIGGSLNAGGITRLTSGVSSSSTSSGALVVTGGVGVSENLNVAGTASVTGVTTLGTVNSTVDRAANFSSPNVAITGGYISGLANLTATSISGTLSTAAQTNVTSVGTLTGLTVSGTTTLATVNTTTGQVANFSSPNVVITGGYVSGLANLSATTISGTLSTAAQTNITSVGTLTGLTTSGVITSTVATGTAPFTVASTTAVTNLNADLWDGNHFADYLNQAVKTTSAPTFAGLTTSAAIVPSANVSINLGSTTAWWNVIYGKATQAQYADLAENYQADKPYPAGTVVMFGGSAEVTLADADTTAVAGIVSTNPAHLMNGGLTGPNVVALGLQGRVPCNVIGPVKKGDMMVSAGFGYAKASSDPKVGQVIGKALSDFAGAKGQIEVVVGRV